MEWLFDLLFVLVISRVIATRPRLSQRGTGILAQSDWRSQFMSLGFGGRRVIIDPTQRIVRIALRRFWFFWKYRTAGFDEVNQVLYGYKDWGFGWWGYQQQDLFTVSLQLKNGEELLLFRFFGEGDFVNNSGLPDFFYAGDYALAGLTKGPQEGDSLRYADLVSHMVGVPIGNPPD